MMKFAASLVAASATLLCFVCLSWVVLEHHVDSYTWNFKKLSSESAFTEADWEATDIVATVATPALHSAEKALSRLHLGFMSDPAKPPACIDMIASDAGAQVGNRIVGYLKTAVLASHYKIPCSLVGHMPFATRPPYRGSLGSETNRGIAGLFGLVDHQLQNCARIDGLSNDPLRSMDSLFRITRPADITHGIREHQKNAKAVRQTFLAQNKWMAQNGHLAQFPKDAFNIAVHVRTGDQQQDEKSTLRQMELVLAALQEGKLSGVRNGHELKLGKLPIKLHIHSQTGAGSVIGKRHGIVDESNYIAKWGKKHCGGKGCELVYHLDEDLLKTIDSFIVADVLVLGYSTLSQSAAFVAEGNVVWMQDWPRVDSKTSVTDPRGAPEIPHMFTSSLLICTSTITINGGNICKL